MSPTFLLRRGGEKTEYLAYGLALDAEMRRKGMVFPRGVCMAQIVRDFRTIPPNRPRTVKRKSQWHCSPKAWIAGWVLTVLGSVFLISVSVIQYQSRPAAFFPDSWIDANPGQSEGVVTDVAVVLASQRPGFDTFRVDFLFQVDGESYKGYAYGQNIELEQRDKVMITYDITSPEIARAEGTRASAIPVKLFFIGLLPTLFGGAFLLMAFMRIYQLRRVLARGKVGEATVVTVTQNKAVSAGKQHPWVVTYHFKVDGTFSGTASIFPQGDSADPPCEANELLPVVYLSHDPQHNSLVLRGDF